MARPPAVVLDSTVLINLAKAGLLEALGRLPEPMFVPREVRDETDIHGARSSHPDSSAIATALDEGALRLLPKASQADLKRLRIHHGLRDTDAAVIACARKHRAIVGSDDAKVRKIAALERVPYGGTGYILARFVRARILTRSEARSHLDRMIARGWWVTVETYSRLLAELGF